MKYVLQFIVLWSFSSVVYGADLRLAVAANFKQAAEALVPLFESLSGHTVEISTASSGKLFAQIRYGAPFHVFMSADADKPKKLLEAGLAVENTRMTYAIGRLVLWSPSTPGVSRDFLHSSHSVAIANPRHAPYGAAAMETLSTVFTDQPHSLALRSGENISQTFQFVQGEHVDAGFVALAQVKQQGISSEYYWLVPEDYHQPIEQQAVVTQHGSQNHVSHEWLRFLASPKAQQIIENLGYRTVSVTGVSRL